MMSPSPPPPLPFYRGGGTGCSLYSFGRFDVYKNTIRGCKWTYGWTCIYKNVTKDNKWAPNIILRTLWPCNWALNTIMGSLTYKANFNGELYCAVSKTVMSYIIK